MLKHLGQVGKLLEELSENPYKNNPVSAKIVGVKQAYNAPNFAESGK